MYKLLYADPQCAPPGTDVFVSAHETFARAVAALHVESLVHSISAPAHRRRLLQLAIVDETDATVLQVISSAEYTRR